MRFDMIIRITYTIYILLPIPNYNEILLVFSDISQKVNESNQIEEMILRYEHKANRS